MRHVPLPSLFQYSSHPSFFTLLALITLASSLNAQVFRPFDAHSVALYTTAPIAGATSSLAFTEIEEIEGDSIFRPLKRIDFEDYEAMISSDENCEGFDFWGSAGMCLPQDVPMWLGSQMRKTDLDTYEYETMTGDVLVFNFGMATGDTSTIFQNADQSLLLISEGEGTFNHLDIEDSVLQFRLAHLNSQGAPLDTDLHEAPITLGAELGAIHFLRIDSFPEMTQPIVLAGHTGAEAGLYQITEADIYDYSEGDLFQYRYSSNESDPFNYTSYYESYTVIERLEDENEISYTFDVHRFKPDSTINLFFEEEFTVSKTAVVSTLPMELEESEHPEFPYFSEQYHIQNISFTPDSCMSEYTYSIEASYFRNCPVDSINCYGNITHLAPDDWFQLPPELLFKQGMGISYSFTGWAISAGGPVGSFSGSTTRRLIYSQKNGSECGDQVVLSTGDHEGIKPTFKVYPNPTSDVLTIRFETGYVNESAVVQVFDVVGRERDILNLAHQAEGFVRINTVGFEQGIYFFRILEENAPVVEGKFVVSR